MGHQGEDNFGLRLIQGSNPYISHYRDFSQTAALDAIALTLFQVLDLWR